MHRRAGNAKLTDCAHLSRREESLRPISSGVRRRAHTAAAGRYDHRARAAWTRSGSAAAGEVPRNEDRIALARHRPRQWPIEIRCSAQGRHHHAFQQQGLSRLRAVALCPCRRGRARPGQAHAVVAAQVPHPPSPTRWLTWEEQRTSDGFSRASRSTLLSATGRSMRCDGRSTHPRRLCWAALAGWGRRSIGRRPIAIALKNNVAATSAGGQSWPTASNRNRCCRRVVFPGWRS